MAGGIDVKVEFPELRELQKAFQQFAPSIARKHVTAAMRRSLSPALKALKANVSRGPTGNLARAVKSKVKSYVSGNAVGIVGFVAAGSAKSKSAGGGIVKKGSDRAFHAGFLEFGTKERFIKTSSLRGGASIASSFRTLGPFRLAPVAKRGKFAGVVRVQTNPKYPKAFFMKAQKGQVLSLREMPIGGKKGKPPIKSAYQESLGEMRKKLVEEMGNALVKAGKDMADRFPAKWRGGDVGPTPF